MAGPIDCQRNYKTMCSVPIESMQRSPFRGQALTTDLAISLGQKAYHCDDWVELEVSKTASIAEANKKADRRVWEAELKADRKKAFLEGREAAAPGFFSSPPFWFGVGIGAAVLIFFSVKAGDRALEEAFLQ